MCYRAQEIEMEKLANFLKSVIAPGASSTGSGASAPTVSKLAVGSDAQAVLHSLQGAAMVLYRKQHAAASSSKKKKKKKEKPEERTATAAAQDAVGSVTVTVVAGKEWKISETAVCAARASFLDTLSSVSSSQQQSFDTGAVSAAAAEYLLQDMVEAGLNSSGAASIAVALMQIAAELRLPVDGTGSEVSIGMASATTPTILEVAKALARLIADATPPPPLATTESAAPPSTAGSPTLSAPIFTPASVENASATTMDSTVLFLLLYS